MSRVYIHIIYTFGKTERKNPFVKIAIYPLK